MLMTRETVSAWVDTDELAELLDEHDLENTSELLQEIVEHETLDVVESDGFSDANTEQNLDELDSLRRRLNDAEDRLDDFEDKGQPMLENAVVRLNKLEDRVAALEDLAP